MKIFKKILKGIMFFLFVISVSCGISILSIRFGLFSNVQTFLVTSSMTTMTHQYIGKIVATDDKINEIMDSNKVIETNENAEKEQIQLPKESNTENIDISNSSDSKRNEAVPDKKEETVKCVDIKGDNYVGHMLIVSNPKKVILGSTNNLPNSGEKLNDMIKRYNGIGGINAGGFVDEGGVGNGGTPTGIIIEDGKIKYLDKSYNSYSIIGFDEDGFLNLGNYTLSQIKKMNIKYAVSFQPFLIVNGKPSKIIGDGGWGLAPRTAIGQKADGTVLMLVIDGRQLSSVGASIKEIQNIMIQYGAVNAANLDGGSSTVMYYQNKLINNPCSKYGERPLPSAFIIKK